MISVLVDTNILLDVLGSRHPHFVASKKIWELAEQNKIKAHVSVISFNNVYYILRKASNAKIAEKAISNIRLIFRPVAVDEKIVDQAISSQQDDFEDAIQYFCAIKSNAEYLITRNPKDFSKRHDLKIVTPEIFLSVFMKS